MNKDTVVFAYARMNPPTRGHTKLVNLVRSLANNNDCDHHISISRAENGTTSGNKNPLPMESKMDYLRMAYPNANLVLASEKVPSMMDQLLDMSANYKNIIVVCGDDRMEDYDRMLSDYNASHFGFSSFSVISAGDRNDKYSSTHARNLAIAGDLRRFFEITAWFENGHDTVNLYDDVRKGMGINTSDEEGTHEEDEKVPAEA